MAQKPSKAQRRGRDLADLMQAEAAAPANLGRVLANIYHDDPKLFAKIHAIMDRAYAARMLPELIE